MSMSIRFSYSPADATLTLMVQDQPADVIERALDRAAETAALEIRILDASNPNRWPAIAEMCMLRGPRFLYRRVRGKGVRGKNKGKGKRSAA